MALTVKCPKCQSNAAVKSVPHMYQYRQSEYELHCMWCGTRKYGDAARAIVDAAIAEQANQERLRQEAIQAAEEARRIAEIERIEAERIAEIERQRAEEERIKAEEEERLRVAEEERLRSENKRRGVTQPRAEKIAARALAIAQLGGDASTLCESPVCDKPHPIGKRYCSKICSDVVARERYNEKKRAAMG